MIHYSCDRCKRIIDSDEELRYVVRLETNAALDDSSAEPADDRDHLLEIHEILERLDDDDSAEIGPEVYQKLRFDLCPECFKKFMKNPVGREPIEQFGFSKN